MTGGTVYFFPANNSGNYASVIGKDGSYTISKLPPGPTKISVIAGSRRMPTEVLTKLEKEIQTLLETETQRTNGAGVYFTPQAYFECVGVAASGSAPNANC